MSFVGIGNQYIFTFRSIFFIDEMNFIVYFCIFFFFPFWAFFYIHLCARIVLLALFFNEIILLVKKGSD